MDLSCSELTSFCLLASENLLAGVRKGNYNYCSDNSMNVILGLCPSYIVKVVTFQESLFACKCKLSKTSRLLRWAATGNCPDRLGWVTARLTTAITCDTDR